MTIIELKKKQYTWGFIQSGLIGLYLFLIIGEALAGRFYTPHVAIGMTCLFVMLYQVIHSLKES